MAGAWDIEIGDITTRRAVMERYGGSRFGGIQPSRQSPNVLIYSDPTQGELHGYNFDGWDPDPESPVYQYTGEGQVGDQDPEAKGNGAILRHLDDGRRLRLFEAAGPNRTGGKPQRYVGEFRLDPVDPWQFREAPDRQGDMRHVVVFRFIAVEPAQSRAVSEAGFVDVLPAPTVDFDERSLREVAMQWLEQRTDGGRQALTAEKLKDFDGGYPLIDETRPLWQPPGFSGLFSIRHDRRRTGQRDGQRTDPHGSATIDRTIARLSARAKAAVGVVPGDRWRTVSADLSLVCGGSRR